MKEITRERSQGILEQYDNEYRLYQLFVSEIKHQIESILQTFEITYNAITFRLKSRESLAEKIERKQGKYTQISDITDIAGVRIITYYSEDVDKIAEIIEREFDVDVKNSIDKRHAMEPDRFGYCSVHYIVRMNKERLALREYQAFEGLKCEIQIRSILQHAWAEIEHDIGYKNEIMIPKEMRRSFSRIAGLLEVADKEFNDIRKALVEYKTRAQEQIEHEEFLSREVDAVLLEVMINTDVNIQRINRHIEELVGNPVIKVENNQLYESTIKHMKWLGIETVQQVYDMISKYTETAMEIADEKLKNYKERKDKGTIRTTIAFFYLCYAVLLKEKGSKEEILRYFQENHIGVLGHLEDSANQFYELGKRLK